MTVGELGAVQVGLGPRAVQGKETVAVAIELGPEERTDGGLTRVRKLQGQSWRTGKSYRINSAPDFIRLHLYPEEMGSKEVLQLLSCPASNTV